MKIHFQILTISILFILLSCVSKSKIDPGNYNEKIDGISINYTIAGKGPIMIVGHPNSGKIGYELTLKPLEDKFTMVYYDSRGTGNSKAPKKLDDYNSDKLTNEIDLLRRKLGVSKIWLLGHSDQSAIALQYAVEHPQNVSGLILTGTSFIGDMDETIKRRKDSENKRKNESPWFLQVVEDWEYMYVNKTDKDKNGRNLSDAPTKWWTYDEETFAKVKPIIKRIAEAGRRKPIDGESYFETQPQREKYLDIQKKIRTLQTKVLIINGKFDTNNPPIFAEELQRNLPNSKLILIDKAGHFPWVEQPENTFEEINKWLNKQL